MPEQPLVSIVVRTKDRSPMLERAIDDILAQSHCSWEIIVVNDGGDPAPVDAALADRSTALARRGRVIHLPQSGGMEAASNTGLRAATGTYIAIHDDDDTWDPEFLATTVAHLESTPDALAVAACTEIVVERADDDGFTELERLPFPPPGGLISLFDLLVTNRVVPIGLLIRHETMTALGGYDESLDVVGDWEFNLRLTAKGRVDYLPGKPLAHWRQRPAVAGPLANSVFAAYAEHVKFDRIVRDRALRAEAEHQGLGTPLFVARLMDESERRIMGRLDAIEHRIMERLTEMENAVEGHVRHNSPGAFVRRSARRLTGRRPK